MNNYWAYYKKKKLIIITDEKEELGLIAYWNRLEHNFNKSTNEQRRYTNWWWPYLINPLNMVFE